MELTILMPCLNEAETLEICIKKAQDSIKKNNIIGEVLIADNGSTDGSIEIAERLGARVEHVKLKGYGNALRGGIEAAYGKYIIMADSDDSYDFSNLLPYVEKLREGFDLVMGNRFKGGIKDGAMPFLHRYLGNPVLSFIGRLFFDIKIGDFHCGLRGFTKEAALKMDLQTTGMEFASEMVVKASLHKMKITEVPTTLSPDGRSRPPHLRTWNDGWRHLRFLLLYSPSWLFLYPGLILLIVGIVVSSLLIYNPIQIGTVTFDIHSLLYSSSAVIIGIEFVFFYYLSHKYAYISKLYPTNYKESRFVKWFNLEKGLIIGGILISLGVMTALYSVIIWDKNQFGTLNPQDVFRIVIPASSSIIIGFQVLVFSFFYSVLDLKK